MNTSPTISAATVTHKTRTIHFFISFRFFAFVANAFIPYSKRSTAVYHIQRICGKTAPLENLELNKCLQFRFELAPKPA